MRHFAAALTLAASVLVVSAGAVQPLGAQAVFGPQLAWGNDSDFGIGARVEFGLGDLVGLDEAPFSDIFAMTTATYFFTDCGGGFFPGGTGVDCSFFEIAAGAAVPFDVDEDFTPYAGAGIHLGRFGASTSGESSSQTKLGLGLVGGVKFPLGGTAAFAEGKINLGTYDQLVIQFGVLFGPSR
jgi:opacity protein-like surface antigen